MPGVLGKKVSTSGSLRDREIAAAVNHLIAANLRGTNDPETAARQEMIEDYMCAVLPPDEDEDSQDSDSDVSMVSEVEEEDTATGEEEIFLNRIEDVVGELAGEIAERHVSEDQTAERLKIQALQCGCSGNKKCKTAFTEDELLNQRYTILELTKSEKELVILSQLNACTNFGPTTCCSKRKSQTNRKLSRTSYFFHGQRICREMFCFLHCISRDKLTALKDWLSKHGVCPVIHKAGGRRFNTKVLTAEDVTAAVNFLTNHAEENAVFLPGRVPHYKRADIKLLPSSQPKAQVWRKYKLAMELKGERAMSQTAFLDVWRQYLPSVIVCRPMTDLCWQCQRNNTSLYRSANLDEAEKETRLEDQRLHLHHAKVQREAYQQMVSASVEAVGDLQLGPNLPCSRDVTVHYSFDYAQQVHYPAHPLQPGPMYFLVPRKCGIFGVNCEGVRQQVNFLIDEGMCISKGSIAVISQLHFFFRRYGFGERHLQLHCDNCSGQNKNKFLLWYLSWRTLHGLHQSITLNFLLAGHTKFAPDYCFGLFKKAYRRTEVSTLEDIAQCVTTSAPATNIPQLVGDESGKVIVPTYQWQDFLSPYFRPVPNVKNYHHFRFSADEPGVVYAKEFADSPEEKHTILRNPDQRPPRLLPPSQPPPGLSRERQEYLYNKIREYCRPDAQDVTCPLPQ